MHGKFVLLLIGALAFAIMIATCGNAQATSSQAVPQNNVVTLVPNGAQGAEWSLTFGIPLPAGQLDDARLIRIVDVAGNEVPASVTPSLRWHFKDNSIRALRVQLRVPAARQQVKLRFELGHARERDLEGWPYVDDLVRNAEGVKVPGVLALLDPGWMSASGIAGLQQPASRNSAAYDAYFATQFLWARSLPTKDHTAWLFDRPTTLFKQYVRTGDQAHLREAIASYRFYMAHIQHRGSVEPPNCSGGWGFLASNPCDPKYVYVEPILLAVGIAGDDSLHTDALVARMIRIWDTMSWRGNRRTYDSPELPFTERLAGLGLIQTVNAYELTGDAAYLQKMKTRIGWLHDHQASNPDGLGNDGSWRHSWQMHEGGDYDPETDIRGASPWMSENIIDGLWQAWQIDRDPRIPGMISAFGRYMEDHGWITDDVLRRKDWTTGCAVERRGPIAWYWSSSQAKLEDLMQAQDSEGWYSDDHNVQLMLPVAAARYFEKDAAYRERLTARLEKVSVSYSPNCARSSGTARRFNWNNRGSGVVQWFMYPGNEYIGAPSTD